MAYIYPNSKIAVGNNNAGSLVVWESITPSNEPHFFAPVWFGRYLGGDRAVRADGSIYLKGYPTINGTLTMTQGQLYYLITTYCGGGFSGAVTAAVRLLNPAAYTNVNAQLIISDLPSNKKVGLGYADYKVQLARIVLI